LVGGLVAQFDFSRCGFDRFIGHSALILLGNRFMEKRRLDILLVERNLCESREKAQRLILAGDVLVNDQKVFKPAQTYPVDVPLALVAPEKYVSRGGWKLEQALQTFGCDVRDKIAADIGASTGGFTDCLLQNGARKVYAVDVGQGQLAWKLRNDPRVVVRDRINARYLVPDQVGEPVDIATIDVSFISLTLILPPAFELLKAGGCLIALIKPQFEVGREKVGRGGVVREIRFREEAVNKIRDFVQGHLPLILQGVTPSPILGPAGNEEFLGVWNKP
jgi:23S rRNA (cytidine1920-2'-O)/16S rRNA (cytidine1409-2'-O)-methyltransferase